MSSVLSSSSHGILRGPVIRRVLRAGTIATTLIVVLLITLFTNVPPASAYWKSSGAAPAAATTGTLLAPTTVTASGTRNVAVSWTPSAGTLAPAGYFVTRTAGTTTTAACGSGPTALVTTTSCTDTGASDGTYTYTVTAVFRSWTARSAPSAPATVTTPPATSAANLVFTVAPKGPESATTRATVGPFTVQLQDSSNRPVIAGADTIVRLTSTRNTTFFAARCDGAPILTATILAGTSDVSFYYGSLDSGNTTVTAASGSLTSATHKFTFNAINADAYTVCAPGTNLQAARLAVAPPDSRTAIPAPALEPTVTPESATATAPEPAPTVQSALPSAITPEPAPAPAPAPAPVIEPPAPTTEAAPVLAPVEAPTPTEPPTTEPLIATEPELPVGPTSESTGS